MCGDIWNKKYFIVRMTGRGGGMIFKGRVRDTGEIVENVIYR